MSKIGEGGHHDASNAKDNFEFIRVIGIKRKQKALDK